MPKLDRFRIDSARRLRSTMTDEERILWSQLWRIPLEGTHFRRQAVLGRFYPDFVSHRLKLVIELDGVQHSDRDAMSRDAVRDRWIEEQGYRVLRFWNHEVLQELDSVLDTIYAAVDERRKALPPHPTPALRADPPHRGEGKEPLMPDLLLELRSEEIPALPCARSAGGARTHKMKNGMRMEVAHA